MKKLLAALIFIVLMADTPSHAVQCGPNPVRGCLFIEEQSPEDIFLFVNMDPSSQIADPIPLASSNEAPKIFNHVPKPSQKFSTWKKLNPVWWFGNADDPVPPPAYRKGKCCRKFMWYMRNPFHNFDHYVIGIGDKHFTRVGRYPDRVANPNGGWNWAVCRYRILRLPFVDYQRGRFEFYLGWRNGGNFGAKLNFSQKRAATPTKGA